MSQNEERLKQELRNESHEITEMNETIQNLNDQRHELESRITNCHQQIEGIDALKNEISEKNKVNIPIFICIANHFQIKTRFSTSDNKNVESTVNGHEKDVAARIKVKFNGKNH